MYKDCQILSDLLDLPYSIYTDDCIKWLYDLYISQYKLCPMEYKGKRLIMRKEPLIANKDESFMHLICGGNCKEIHEERARRLLWAKDIILNEPCTYNCDCEKILIWKQKSRIKMYLKKYNYLVIIEERKEYWIFVTGYYVSGSHNRKELTKEYHECKKRSTSNV